MRVNRGALLAFFLLLLPAFAFSQCNRNNICEPQYSESDASCLQDCTCFINTICDYPTENFGSCADCSCNGDGNCDPPGETMFSCPSDCPCDRDGFCEPYRGESILTCPQDCTCNFNTICQSPNETVETCSDCTCNLNGICEPPLERIGTCSDCICNCGDDCNAAGVFCDSPREVIEYCDSCRCDNDGRCEPPRENCYSCPGDCDCCTNDWRRNDGCIFEMGECSPLSPNYCDEDCPSACCDRDEMCEPALGETSACGDDCYCDNDGRCEPPREAIGTCGDCTCNLNGICEPRREAVGACSDCTCNFNGLCEPLLGENTTACRDCQCDNDGRCDYPFEWISLADSSGTGICTDCLACDVDGTCDSQENCNTCPLECLSCCGNRLCEPALGETLACSDCACYENSVCAYPRETPELCPEDCRCNNDGVCNDQSIFPRGTILRGRENSTWCGDCTCNNNGVCDSPTETRASCPSDCICIDNDQCDFPKENCLVCNDCECCEPDFDDDGDRVCMPFLGENSLTCPADCGSSCGNGVCQLGPPFNEYSGNCPEDCYCNDLICEADVDEVICEERCSEFAGYCHDFCREVSRLTDENCQTCPEDCSSCPCTCGRYGCQNEGTGYPGCSETCLNCMGDCPSCDSDGACLPELGENCQTAPEDCAPCPAYCGDGRCDDEIPPWPLPPTPPETPITCPLDCSTCGPVGGVRTCEPEAGENCQTCPGDCGICPSCNFDNADSVCPAALPEIQRNCTMYYCDPQDNKCVYDMLSFHGRPCGNEKAPYYDECHVDVCINGVCVYNSSIDSSNPQSAGGLPPLLASDAPWLRGECLFNTTSNDFDFNQSEIHPFCGHWGCEAPTEDPTTCCEDCGCPEGSICRGGRCQPIYPPVPATCSTSVPIPGPNTCDKGEDLYNCPADCRGWYNWVPITLVALLIGYFLAALAYMASQLIGSPDLHAWAKNELYETSVSALFVGLAVSAIGFLSLLSLQLIGVDYQVAANNYIYLLSADLMHVYALITKGIFTMGLLSYLTFSFSTPNAPLPVMIGVTGSITPFGGMNLLSNNLIMVSNVLSFAIISVVGQKVVLDFIMQVGFRFLLPVAIFLRCFTLTRKLGATLMAVAIGVYIVYPMTLVMNAQIYASVPKIPQEEYNSSLLPLNDFNIGAWAELFMGPNFGKWCAHWYDWLWMCWLFAILEWVINFIKALFLAIAFIIKVMVIVMRHGTAEVTAAGFDYYASMMPWAMQPVAAAFLFPILDIIIVITAIRSLSEAMGGDVRITGLAEFI